ncbi:MAG: leucyl/phenylalanyl-tRNA--protein transferase [Synechococcus lacustris]
MNELLAAYAAGWFPMAEGPDGHLGLFRSPQRALLPLDQRFHIPRSLRRVLNSQRFELRLNTAFEAVVEGCADRSETWISPELRHIYSALHGGGWAHSIEAWDEEGLAGGQLGLAIGACWIGESMFHRRPHGSNVVLVGLQQALLAGGFQLYDVQILNPHLERFGAFCLADASFTPLLQQAVRQRALLRIKGKQLVSEAWMSR